MALSKWQILILVALLAVGFGAGWYLLGRDGAGDGAGDAAIKQQLETLGRNQQLLTTRLDGIAKDLAQSQQRVGRIEERVGAAQAGVAEVAGQLADSQKSLAESAGIIAESERIIREIQQRAKSNSAKP